MFDFKLMWYWTRNLFSSKSSTEEVSNPRIFIFVGEDKDNNYYTRLVYTDHTKNLVYQTTSNQNKNSLLSKYCSDCTVEIITVHGDLIDVYTDIPFKTFLDMSDTDILELAIGNM